MLICSEQKRFGMLLVKDIVREAGKKPKYRCICDCGGEITTQYTNLYIGKVVKKFPERIRKRSTIIDYVIDNGGKAHWQVELEKIKAFTDRQKKSFESTQVSKLKEKLEKMLSDKN